LFSKTSRIGGEVTKHLLEGDLWSLIYLNPKELLLGNVAVIPSIFF